MTLNQLTYFIYFLSFLISSFHTDAYSHAQHISFESRSKLFSAWKGSSNRVENENEVASYGGICSFIMYVCVCVCGVCECVCVCMCMSVRARVCVCVLKRREIKPNTEKEIPIRFLLPEIARSNLWNLILGFNLETGWSH